MKRQYSQIRAGVIISYITLVVSCVIPLVYTPIMLGILGQAEYGLYSLSSSVISYLSLLTLGFGSTIIRYLSKYRAEGKRSDEERIYGFFLILYCLLAILVLVCALFIANNIELVFRRGLSSEEISKMYKLVMIMSVSTAISFPTSVFSSVISAHERFVFIKCVNLISTVALPVANLIALYMGFASIGMAAAGMLVQAIVLPVDVWYCFNIIKIRPKFEKLPKKFIKELITFSFYILIGQLVDMLFWSTDKVILGMLASSTAVAIYNIGGTFNNMVIQLSTSITGVLIPKINRLAIEEHAEDKLTELFIRVGRVQYLMIALIIAGFTVFGQSFILLWVGAEYAESYWIAVLTMFPLCIPLIQNTGLNILIAQNKHRFRSIIYLMIAVINVILTYLIVPYMGGIGAAFCSCVSYLIGQGLIMNVYYYKVIKINIPLFWLNILKMSIIPGIMIVLGLAFQAYVAFSSWTSFLLSAAVFVLVYVVLTYRFIMNDYEKDIVRKPVKKIFLCKKRG